jgi:predicted transcriptional regulator
MRAWAASVLLVVCFMQKRRKALQRGGEKYFYNPDFVSAIAVLLKMQQYSWYFCSEPFIKNLPNL